MEFIDGETLRNHIGGESLPLEENKTQNPA
jgi:hypothetical protein